MKVYITFGYDHRHEVGGVVFDRWCIAEFEAESEMHGREMAFSVFGDKFYTSYLKVDNILDFFPRGIISVPREPFNV
jgi:hypothetical protein